MPEDVVAARELCARYLEELQAGRLLPEAGADEGGKYDVSRQIGSAACPQDAEVTGEIRLLPAA